MSRYRITRHTAILSFYNTPQATLIETSPTRFKQRTGDGAYHVSQKTVRPDGKDICVFLSVPPGIINSADVGFHIGMQLAETGKISVFHQHATHLVHTPHIGFKMNPVGQFMQERILDGGDMIGIGTRGGTETGMGRGNHPLYSSYRDIFREKNY